MNNIQIIICHLITTLLSSWFMVGEKTNVFLSDDPIIMRISSGEYGDELS